MKLAIPAFAILIGSPVTIAHNAFSRLIVNGTVTPDYAYVRNTTYTPHPNIAPYDRLVPYTAVTQEELDATNITCGRDAFDAAGTTLTATVIAGEEIGFEVYNCCGLVPHIWHEGPAQAYMSAPPSGTALEKYRGDGEWFKVAYWGPTNQTHWFPKDKSQLLFKLPGNTPPGKYLLRVEQFMPLLPDYTQWYVNCAHIEVRGPGGGDPAPFTTAKFPGTYKIEHPGISLPPEVGIARPEDPTPAYPYAFLNLTAYQPPGPALWTGQ
ncbi:lytic polysaccharide monooxygenase [Melanomma pulvis-pyrius CBS 109.77]|uniref:lytic cellulose monooxygenase (C4-dehydrogenating) n=1 Tax=Melanomma pulvis-pyrius CBS 109.77 TaxID=1314802 RepID=A0A6A6XCL4_9PLEO|nr:lytic polysaccharide monooxygenase [Melanomma pulvis-pyrius CBS 109.77]